MPVKRIVSRHEAVRLWDKDNLYDAEEWIVDPEQTGTLLHLHRRLSPTLTKQLRFELRDGPREPAFVSDTELDNQATRGVRELTPESAALLDQIIEVTDRLPRSDELITVTEEMIGIGNVQDRAEEDRLPEEVPTGSAFTEGSVQRILVNRYERDRDARHECITHYGPKCFLCGFDFVAVYGGVMADFIHVHHLTPLASVGADYQVNPVQDLRPVCPNCHAVLHRREPPYSLEEVRSFLQGQE
jgi:predicted HNH restriction endonuclease